MIYEVEFTATSREAARTVAKQLIEEHVLESTSITPCDVIAPNAAGEVEEQYLVKVKGLTTAVQYLLKNYKLKNFTAKAVTLNDDKATCVRIWCNEEDDVIVKPAHSWREERARILAEANSAESDEEPASLEAHHIIAPTASGGVQTANEFTHHNKMGEVQIVCEAPQELIDATMVHSEHVGSYCHPTAEGCRHMAEKIADATIPNAVVFGNPGTGMGFSQKLDIVTENTGTTSQERQVEVEATTEESDDGDKKRSKLPKWAEEEGLTLAEYKKRCNERTAARWGITMSEYSKLAAEARKNEKPLKEYFEEQGLTFNEDLADADDEIDDSADLDDAVEIKQKKINYAQFKGFEHVLEWAEPYGLTEKQLKFLTGQAPGRKRTTPLPDYALATGINSAQYGVVSRIRAALTYGLSLTDYDNYYNAAKKLNLTLREYYQLTGKTMVPVEYTIEDLCRTFMKAYKADLENKEA